MKSFVELLVVADDKASGKILAEVLQYIEDYEIAAIPGCLYRRIRPDGSEIQPGEMIEEGIRIVPNLQVLFALAYGRALHENPDITYEEVRAKMPVTDREKTREIIKELYYFYSSLNREEVDRMFPSEPIEEEEPNPPEESEPQPDLPSETNSEA